MNAYGRVVRIGLKWSPALVLPLVPFWLISEERPLWVLMWAVAVLLYAALKWVSWFDCGVADVPAWKHAAYLLAWPGMDSRTFLRTSLVVPPTAREWFVATGKMLVGFALLFYAALQTDRGWNLIVGWVEMIGLVLMLHCGLFHLLSCLWRTFSIEATPIMNSPLLATSLSEFWGRRWNRAFRDLTHRFLFLPLSARIGPAPALGLGFVLSGLVHELVITVPAHGGYGGPTLFFLIQAMGLFIERTAWCRRLGLGKGFSGWLFTATMLLAPVGWLLPSRFVCQIIVPFCRDVLFEACGI